MDSAASIFLVIALFIIMLGMGLSLTADDFKRVVKYPLAVFIGFVNQIVFLPIIAYVLIGLFNVNPEIAIGIMILAACPGGPTSNLITLLAKGDTALSITLTTVNSLITIITIPIVVSFALAEFSGDAIKIDAPVGQIAGSLVVVIAIPLAVGMTIKRYWNSFALKMDKPVRIASSLVLVLVIVGLVVKEQDHLAEYFKNAWLIALTLNVSTMVIGYFTAKLARLNFKQALCISIECGNQNGTLAIHIAVVSLARPDFAIAGAVYSLLMFVTATVPILIGNWRHKSE